LLLTFIRYNSLYELNTSSTPSTSGVQMFHIPSNLFFYVFLPNFQN
jgi:hypothetical protein